MKRRDFLKGATLLLAAEAFAFGQGLSTQPEGKGGARAILYGTRYGATRDTAGWIAEGMGGDVPLYDIEKLSDAGELRRYSELVIGSGIFPASPNFLSTNIMSIAFSASSLLSQTITPLPAARPSALTTTSYSI